MEPWLHGTTVPELRGVGGVNRETHNVSNKQIPHLHGMQVLCLKLVFFRLTRKCILAFSGECHIT